jgi:hypothetical protein
MMVMMLMFISRTPYIKKRNNAHTMTSAHKRRLVSSWMYKALGPTASRANNCKYLVLSNYYIQERAGFLTNFATLFLLG